MSKKVKVIISVLAVALLLTVGGTAMVMAQEEPEEEPTPPAPEAEARGLLARVAEILEIDEEDLINAFKQAHEEMREEAFIRALDKAVKEERITQEEADEIREWWEQRPIDEIEEWLEQKPEVIKPNMIRRVLRFRAFGFPALGRGHAWGGFRGRFWMRPPKLAD